MTIDVLVTDHGTVVSLWPASDAGRQWCLDYLDPDCSRFGESYVVGHRYAADIIDGMHGDGLVIA